MKILNRIKRNEDFTNIIHNGLNFRSYPFSLFILPNNLNYARIGISIQKKLGNAVHRNKAKRQINAIFQKILDLNIGKDYVLIVYKGYDIKEFKKNESLLTELYLKGNKNSEKIA